jgi:hypothetical protein
VIRIPVGGTFGSSIQMNTPVPIGVALALKARRPVKLALTRKEDMHDHAKYPAIIRLKIAARRDGTLLGADQRSLTQHTSSRLFPGRDRRLVGVILQDSPQFGIGSGVNKPRHAGFRQSPDHVRCRVADG